MEVEFLYIQSQKTPWIDEGIDQLTEKIGHSLKFKTVCLKSKRLDREDSARKVQLESEALLKSLGEGDFVVLFDERGKSLDSKAFAQQLRTHFDRGTRRIKFVVGGAFGVSEEIKKRSNWTVSLSNMTFNHQVALIMALEQIYRATQIWSGRPYHNE